MSRISDILSKQVAVAETLLQRAIASPDGDRNTRIAGYIRYDESITRPLAKDVEAWQTETTEFLRVLYGENARQVADFERCINDKSHYFKFREGIQSELQDCISQLKAFIKADAMKQELKDSNNSHEESGKNKAPMVFISHSSKDIAFVEALVDLLEFLGLNNNTMFCSSVPGYGIPLSGRIIDNLLSIFENNNLYVIFVQSPSYYNSPISLNEMGAAWILKSEFCSLLTQDMEFDKMKGVIDSSYISIKVNAADASSRLNQMKDDIVSMFNLKQPDASRWETKRNNFLKLVDNNFVVNQQNNEDDVEKEYKRLQVEKLKQEAIEKKQARIRGNIIDAPGNGNRKLKIFNAGQAVARNVNVEWLNPDEEVYVQWEFGLIGEISPQNGRSYNIGLCMGHPDTMRLRYTWADDYKEDNVFEEDVQL